MVKRIIVILDEEEHRKLKEKKDSLGLSWPQALKKGIECLEREKLLRRT